MADLPGLQKRREQRSFPQWDEFLAPELVALSEVIVRQLIDRLSALGSAPSRDQVQEEISRCVRQFNGLNRAWQHPWICTVEREDICLVLERLGKLCGFSAAEDWAGERDW